jgi:hypothetical protein
MTDLILDTKLENHSIIENNPLKKLQNVAKVEDLPENEETSKEATSNSSFFDELKIDDATDDASVLVIILQSEATPHTENINNLKWFFSDPYFTVQVCRVDPPGQIVAGKNLNTSQYLENYYMRKALAYAGEGPYINGSDNKISPQRWWTKLPCIIVKDNSISNLIPSTRKLSSRNFLGGIKKRIKTALERAKEADLFFLCKWDDNCEIYKNSNLSPKRSNLSTSTQAIMYTPLSRDFIRDSLMKVKLPLSDYLNLNISEGNLLATVFVPSIIDFDMNLITPPQNYETMNEHLSPQLSQPVTTTAVWLIIVIVFIALIIWAVLQLMPKLQNNTPRV